MILITRPIEEATILADELKQKEIQTHIEPLIYFKNKKVKYDFTNPSNYIVSSIRAVQSIKDNNLLPKILMQKNQFFVVGKKVAEALYSIGTDKIENHFLNSALLTEFIEKNNINNPFVYLCSNNVNEDMILSFKEMNKPLEQVILYETIPSQRLKPQTIKLISDTLINSVVLYSLFTAETFLKLIRRSNLQEHTKNLYYYCLSKRIAEFMIDNGFKNVFFSPISEQKALINLINSRVNCK